jgi:hypothetical protein
LIADMPAAKCIPKKARDRKALIGVRKKFETQCGKPASQWQQLGAVVFISGVGFFDIPHTQNPARGELRGAPPGHRDDDRVRLLGVCPLPRAAAGAPLRKGPAERPFPVPRL